MTERVIHMTGTIERLRQALDSAEAVVIGAGAGLSTAAGFRYTGERFHKYFQNFIDKYGFRDMYSGGFYPFETLGEHWAYWSRYIYVNRYMDPPKSVYGDLYRLVKDKEYFVLTTNVDHCFQKTGFDKERLYYTQGDYGLFQCSKPCHDKTYDNEETVRAMVEAQGFHIMEDGSLNVPESGLCRTEDNLLQSEGGLRPAESAAVKMTVPDKLIPYCPKCGRPITMNLRADDTFVQDEGWYQAAKRYEAFLEEHGNGKILFLELGVGYNTPGIIKYPFWKMTAENPKAMYACINYGEACCPKEIEGRAICIDGDIGDILCQCDNNGKRQIQKICLNS